VEVGDLRSAARKDSVDGAERSGSGNCAGKEGVFVGISAGKKRDECISSTLSGASRELPEMISRD